jgi:predicted dehydrogenase
MKIGILSAAHLHVDAYIPILQTLPDVVVVGIADEDRARAEATATRFGVRVFENYAALLDERLDAVVVCSENSRHRALVEMAAVAGAHVLCEKPLATTVTDAREMIDTCAQAGVKLMTAFPMRFSPALSEVQSRLQAGTLGQIYCFNATNQGELPAHIRAWFVDKELAGGGALTDHIVHLADVFRWYLDSEIVEVYAQMNRILHADTVEVETAGYAMLTFANGVFATIDCSWSKPSYYPTWGGLGFEMVTDRGVVAVDAFRQNLVVYRHARQRPVWAFWGSDANRAMLKDFVAAVRDDRDPGVSGTDGLHAVEAVAAAYESVRIGQPVRL